MLGTEYFSFRTKVNFHDTFAPSHHTHARTHIIVGASYQTPYNPRIPHPIQMPSICKLATVTMWHFPAQFAHKTEGGTRERRPRKCRKHAPRTVRACNGGVRKGNVSPHTADTSLVFRPKRFFYNDTRFRSFTRAVNIHPSVTSYPAKRFRVRDATE